MKFIRKLLFVGIICIFGNVDKHLYGMESSSSSSVVEVDEDALSNELGIAVTNKDINVIAVKRFLLIGQDIYIFNRDKIDEIFGEIQEKIIPNKWTLLIFSEYFFGKQALDNSTVKYIVEKCRELTESHKKLIVHVNFLHKFDISDADCPLWVKHEYIPISDADIGDRLINAPQGCIFLAANASNTRRVANYSLIIWNKVPISIYRKSTYCNEANDMISCGRLDIHAYEFGNFETKKLITDSEPGGKIASFFAGDTQSFVTRICADMNKKDFLTDAHLKEMLVLPANEAPPFEELNTVVLQVDDNMRFNRFILLRNGANTIFLSPDSIACDSYLGMCFALKDVHFDSGEPPTIFFYFSDRPSRANMISLEEESEDEDCCCSCCCK